MGADATAVIRLTVDAASLQSGFQQAATIASQKGQTIKEALLRATDAGIDSFKNLGGNIASTLSPINLVTGSLGSLSTALGLSAGTAGLGSMIAASIASAESMADLSIKTGIQVEQLSRFTSIAKLSGASMEDVGGIIKKLSISAVSAYSGNEKLARSFDALGISTQELKSISPDELLIRVARGIQGIDPMIVQELMAQLGGRGATNVLPFLRELTERIDQTGVKISTQFAKDAKDFSDNITLMKTGVAALSNQLTSNLLPSINSVLGAMLSGESISRSFLASAVDWGGNLPAQLAQAELKLREAVISRTESEDPGVWEDTIKRYELRVKMLQDRIGSAKSGLNPEIDIKKNEAARIAALLNNKPTAASAGDGFLQGLQKRIEKADEGEYAMLRLQAAEKGVADAAGPLIAQLKSLDEIKVVSGYENELARQNAEIEYQISLIGKSSYEVAMLNIKHKMQLDLARQIEQIERSKGAMSDMSIAQMNAATTESISLQKNSISLRINQEREFTTGAQKALSKYADDSRNYASMAEGAFTHAFGNMESALAGFITTGKIDFAQLADSIISDMARMAIKALVLGPIINMMTGGGGGFLSGLFADGGVFVNGNVTPFAQGGVVSKPTFFPMANGMGLMGEAGPEAVMPLRRDNQGRLGVMSSQQGTHPINIVINNNAANTETTAEARTNSQGGIDVLINVIKSAMANDIRNNGPLGQTISNNFGLRRTVS